MSKWVTPIHHMSCILMKFGTVVDLSKKPETQKKFSKTSNYLRSYDYLKNTIFPRSASLHMLKTFLTL